MTKILTDYDIYYEKSRNAEIINSGILQKRIDGVRLNPKTTAIECVCYNDPESVELARVLKSELSECVQIKTSQSPQTHETMVKIRFPNERFAKPFIRVKNGSITGLWLYKTKIVGDHFLEGNTTLRTLVLNDVEQIGDGCFSWVLHLERFRAPNLSKIGKGFFMMLPDSDKENFPIIKTHSTDMVSITNIARKAQAASR